MTRSKFAVVLKSAKSWFNAAFVFGATFMMLAVYGLMSLPAVKSLTLVFRDQATPLREDGRYGAIVGLLIGVLLVAPSMLVPLALAAWVDRRFGASCPECHASLTLWKRGEQLLRSGKCGKCGAQILASETSAARPSHNTDGLGAG